LNVFVDFAPMFYF